MREVDLLIKWIKDPKNKAVMSLMVFFFVGAILLFSSKYFYDPPTHEESSISNSIPPPSNQLENRTTLDYIERLEKQLEEVLCHVQGIKNIKVIITLAEDEFLEPAFNITSNEKVSQESDSEGGIRTVTESQSAKQAILLKKANDDSAMILKKTAPKIKGVLMVVEGISSSRTTSEIIKATATLLDIPIYKVSLLNK